MEVENVYQYSKLTEEDAIRLIYLQPCDDLEAGIQCSMKDAKLAEYRHDISDHYIAVSYVWGGQGNTQSITVDGKPLKITAMLDSALRHIRDHQRVLRVWADGVCINQNDTHDRSRQVRLMGDIYSTAQHTIIFLELPSKICDFVFKQSGQNGGGSDISSKELPLEYKADVEEVLARPWFTRVWILQELVLSLNPWVQCGTVRVRWHLFCKSILSPEFSNWNPNSLSDLKNMNNTRINFTTTSQSSSNKPPGPPGESLLDLLLKRNRCGLTNPRDLFYAHLGLVDAETRNMVPINYDKTVAQVYEDITRLYIGWIGIGPILSLVGQHRPEQRQQSLPSWVLDWSLQYRLEDRPSGRDSRLDVLYYRALYEDQRDNPRDTSLIVPHVMAVHGWNLGTIEEIIPMSSWPKKAPSTFAGRSQSIPLLQDPLYDHTSLVSLLNWVSRTDCKTLPARRLLVGLSASMLPISPPLEKQITTSWPRIKGPEGRLLTQIVSRVSEWPETTSVISEVTTTPLGSTARTRENDRFIKLCILNLVFLVKHCDQSTLIAVLNNKSILAEIPSSAEIGDYVADLHLRNYAAYTILKPHDNMLSKEEELKIGLDLIQLDIEEKIPVWVLTTSVPVVNCRFIATAPGALKKAYYDYYKIDYGHNEVYMTEENQRIFALH